MVGVQWDFLGQDIKRVLKEFSRGPDANFGLCCRGKRAQLPVTRLQQLLVVLGEETGTVIGRQVCL